MLLLFYLLSALVCTALHPATGAVSARRTDREYIQALQRQAEDRLNKNKLGRTFVGGDIQLSADVKNVTFSNPAASGELQFNSRSVLSYPRDVGRCADCGILAFYVDGKTIPEIDWDVGPSWAGLLPISGNKDETRKVSVPQRTFYPEDNMC